MSILIEMIYSEKEPVPCQRTRSHNGRHYTPAKYANYKKALANALKSKYYNLLSKVPQAGTPERSKYLKDNRFGLLLLTYRAANRGDDDNYRKTIQDAIQDSGVIGDDSQIDWAFSAKLLDKNNPRVEFVLLKSPRSVLDLVLIIFNWIKSKLGGG